MVTWPLATRKDHEAFCRKEGWALVPNATGSTGDHFRYEYPLPDGETFLRTRISHPINRETYRRGMWAHILRDQLRVTEEQFWACVNDGVLPKREQVVVDEQPGKLLPLGLTQQLKKVLGLNDGEIAGMTRDEALERIIRFYTDGA